MSDDVLVLAGDCLDVLRSMPPGLQVDAIVTDPPYGLSREPDMTEVMKHWLAGDDYAHRGGGFMGKSWDSFVPGPAVWRACLRVLKPGGYLLSFGGTRTYDLLALAIRLAGFEIRDSIHWIYGSGFPKSLNVAKAIASGTGRPEDIRRLVMGEDYEPSGRGRVNYDHGAGSAMNGATTPVDTPADAQRWDGWGTALKPAHEPIVVARKPLAGTVASNVQQYGTGALNIDGCRVGGGDRSSGGATGKRANADEGYTGGCLERSRAPDRRAVAGERGAWRGRGRQDGPTERHVEERRSQPVYEHERPPRRDHGLSH